MSGLTGLKYNTYTEKLIVHDADYLDWAEAYAALGEKLEEYLQKYISVLKNTALISNGQFAANLEKFAEGVELLLSSNAGGTLSILRNQMNNYIEDIDSADADWN